MSKLSKLHDAATDDDTRLMVIETMLEIIKDRNSARYTNTLDAIIDAVGNMLDDHEIEDVYDDIALEHSVAERVQMRLNMFPPTVHVHVVDWLYQQ